MMRSFEKTTKALALVAFAALAATTGCVAQADDAVADDEAFATPENAGEAIAAWTEGADQDCGCFYGGEIPPQQGVAPLPPMQQPPLQQAPLQQPPMQQPIVQQPPAQQPTVPGVPGIGVPGIGTAGCAPIGGGVPIGGCAAPCAGPCWGPIPGGFHTIVWPITGQFIGVPGLRNCWLGALAGGGC